MSTALARFAEHCHRMATSTPDTRLDLHTNGRATQRMRVGAIPDRERALWRQLAAEIQAYLDQPDDPATVPLTHPEDT